MSVYQLECFDGGFALSLGGRALLRHSAEAPALFLGRGEETIKMYRGNFDIRERVSERVALRFARAAEGRLTFTHPDLSAPLTVTLTERDGLLYFDTETADARYNRLYLRLPAEPGEHVTGGGEQFSALDLRGRRYPIWTREQGVGRNKLTEVTRLADASDGGGGDYHTTFFPQPLFLSSRLYFAQLMNYEYAELDFEDERFHEIAVWSAKTRFVFGAGDGFPALAEKLTGLLGRQPALPDWALRGLWLGVQGGTARATELERHNEWPALWARCNREAVEECGLLGDCVFFMRAGATGSQRYATLLWAGDQCVDWLEDDGLPSALLRHRHPHVHLPDPGPDGLHSDGAGGGGLHRRLRLLRALLPHHPAPEPHRHHHRRDL